MDSYTFLKNKKYTLFLIVAILVTLLYITPSCLSVILPEEANYEIATKKPISKNIYPLNFLGSEVNLYKDIIEAKIIKIKSDKDIYVIDKGLNHNVKTGMEFSIAENDIRIANFVVVKPKKEIAALKLLRKFPEVNIQKGDLVVSFLNAPTGFIPSYMEDPKKVTLEKLTLSRLFRIAIQNSAKVYAAKKQFDEAWQDLKYAKAQSYPRLLGGILWDTEYHFRDLIKLTWLIDPARDKNITKKILLLYKYKFLVEKEKFDAINNVLEKYLNYTKLYEEINVQQELIKNLNQEKQKLLKGKVASPVILEKLPKLIKYENLKLNDLVLKKEKALDKIAIDLGYPSNIKLHFKSKSFPGTAAIHDALNSLVFIPKKGFEVKLAKIGKDISLINYYIAKEDLFPKSELVLGYPSLIGFDFMRFPVTGLALKKSTAFLYQRQKELLEDITLQRDHNIAAGKINIRYYNKLQNNIDLIVDLSRSAMETAREIDDIANSRVNYIKAVNLKHQIRWKQIYDKVALIKVAVRPGSWPDEKLPVKEGLPDLKISLNEALEKSHLLKAANLYKDSVHPFLIESKRRFHKRTLYLEALLGEREALIKILEDRIKEKIIKNWINITIYYNNLGNHNRLVDLAKQKLSLYEQRKDKTKFEIEDAKLNFAFAKFDEQEAKLEFISSLLNFKKSTNIPIDEEVNIPLKKIPPLPDYKQLEQELISIKIFHPEAKIKQKVMQLKQKLEELELAKKGWWVSGPITVRFADGLPGGKTFEWEHDKFKTVDWDDGIDVVDWAGIEFPISIFERTPLGNRIHYVKEAKTRAEIQEFKNELYKEELKMLWRTRHDNLNTAKKALKEAEGKLEQAEKDISSVKKEVLLLKADRLDLISQEKLYTLRNNRYAEYLNNYLKNYIDILSIGHIYKPSEEPEKEDFVLLREKHKYPVLKILDLQAMEIEEAFKRSLRQSIFSWIYARIKRLGIGSSITFKSNFSKVKAKTRVDQMRYHRSTQVFEADKEFARLYSIFQSIKLSKNILKDEKKDLKSLLKYLEQEAKVSLATKKEVNELKDILDNIDLKLSLYEQSYREYSDKIKQLLGIPYNANLMLTQSFNLNSVKKLQLDDPEKLMVQSLYTNAELLLRKSEVELAQKEKKVVRKYRDLSLAFFGEFGLVGPTILGTGLEFWLFDPTFKSERERTEEKEKRFKLRVTDQVQNIRKEIYDTYSDNKYYFLLLKNQSDVIKATSGDFRNSVTLYKEHKIRWDGEYGLKPSILKRINEFTEYLKYIQNYQESFATLLEYIKEYSTDKDIFSIYQETLQISRLEKDKIPFLDKYIKKKFVM